MFIKKCDFKCIKILAKCDTRTEYVYCCHFTITCLSCEKYKRKKAKMPRQCKFKREDAKMPRQCKFKRKNANIKGKTLKWHDNILPVKSHGHLNHLLSREIT
jgi:hypothetical protein